MSWLDRIQSLLVLAAVLLGLVVGQISAISSLAGPLVVPCLMLMLTAVFLNVPLSQWKTPAADVRFTRLSLAVNFLWTPLLGWLLGRLFLGDQPDLWVGLIMLLVTPCTDWYLVFTQLSGGNVRLAATLLPWHLVLQLLLLPVYLWLFAGTLVPVEPSVLIESVLLVLVVPLVVANLFRRAILRTRGDDWLQQNLLARVPLLQLTFLLLAIAAMFASQGAVLLQRSDALLRLLAPVLVFFAINLFLGLWLSRRLRWGYSDCVTFCFATLARNSPVALAIAVAAFPDRPLIALTLVIGPLIELPIMALLTQFFRRCLPRNC